MSAIARKQQLLRLVALRVDEALTPAAELLRICTDDAQRTLALKINMALHSVAVQARPANCAELVGQLWELVKAEEGGK